MDFFEQMEARIPHGEVRTRFAPSPTGYMHVGNLRTALYTWLIARRHHGKFILRIEDTDQGRLVEGAVDVIYKTMAECGLTHDEGPDVGGPVGPYVQSERRDLFGKYAKLLCEKGGAYYCFCQKSDEEEAGDETGEIKKHVCACRNLPLEEAKKRVDELYMYDVLRADRCISVNSLEARVPFGDLDFVQYVMSIDPAKKCNVYGKGKYLLRHAFEGDWLPHDILMREKAAFSDAVGHSMVDDLKAYAEQKYTDEEFETLRRKYDFAQPFTKESLLYRELFEQYYPGQAHMIVDFWMPNKSWAGCDVDDPSARVLANYGDSGK